MPEFATKSDVLALKRDLQAMGLRASTAEFQASLDKQVQQLTIRFGIMWAVGIWFLLIIIKLK